MADKRWRRGDEKVSGRRVYSGSSRIAVSWRKMQGLACRHSAKTPTQRSAQRETHSPKYEEQQDWNLISKTHNLEAKNEKINPKKQEKTNKVDRYFAKLAKENIQKPGQIRAGFLCSLSVSLFLVQKPGHVDQAWLISSPPNPHLPPQRWTQWLIRGGQVTKKSQRVFSRYLNPEEGALCKGWEETGVSWGKHL